MVYYRFGAVKDVVVKMDPNTQQSRGFGFVMFVNEASIEAVLAGGPHNLDGKRVSRTFLNSRFDSDAPL